MHYPKLIENLIERLTKLPGIGRRSAERIIYWLLDHPMEEAGELSNSIMKLKEGLRFCAQCNNLTEKDICSICRDETRDQKTICVIADPKDLLAIERSGSYKGLYHVLLGTISPSIGRGPDDIKIQQLINRVKAGGIDEIVLATDPDNDGEMTALFIAKELKPLNVKISRIGLGIPVGSSLEYADISTLSMSLTARREITA